jgi:hypothetical protein
MTTSGDVASGEESPGGHHLRGPWSLAPKRKHASSSNSHQLPALNCINDSVSGGGQGQYGALGHQPSSKSFASRYAAGAPADNNDDNDGDDGGDDVYGEGANAIHDSDTHTIVSVIIFEDWFITIHSDPFEGLSEVFLRLKSQFGLGRSNARMSPTSPWAGGGPYAGDESLRSANHRMMSTAWVLATLLDFITESFLPDHHRWEK